MSCAACATHPTTEADELNSQSQLIPGRNNAAVAYTVRAEKVSDCTRCPIGESSEYGCRELSECLDHEGVRHLVRGRRSSEAFTKEPLVAGYTFDPFCTVPRGNCGNAIHKKEGIPMR